MELFILGVVLVFVKTNLQLLDTGLSFYISNAVGYLLIYSGIRKLRDEIPGLQQLVPYVLIMVMHSVGFTVLNGTGHSIQTIPLSNSVSIVLAVLMTLLAIWGMGMIFYILDEVVLSVSGHEESGYHEVSRLKKIPGLFLILLTVICILYFTTPAAASCMMLVLLTTELVFICSFSAKVKVVRQSVS